MKTLLVLLLIVAAIAAPAVARKQHNGDDDDDGGHKKDKHDHHDDDDYSDDYEALQKRLDLVTSRLHTIDDELDERFDEELRKKALSLEYRVSVLEEENCDKDHYDCGSPDHECVSRLLVCDGTKDCRNGDDEKHCDLPTKKGDHFEGKRVFENCSEHFPENFDFSITGVKVHSDYPAFPIIRAVLHFVDNTEDDDHEVALPTIGYYRYATHKLVLKPPQGKGLALVCDFDGHNDDRCVGDIKTEGSMVTCARFIFHRKDDEDEEEESSE